MEQITDVKTTEMNLMPSAGSKRYWWKAIASFLMVLFTMPLGHALMIIMEHVMNETVLHYSAFAMGAVGMVMVIIGVFAQGDTRQTLWGFFGGLLFWTGWVEFLFMYFANRFGTQPELDPVTGEIVTRPEYLILPASFGFWMMVMVMYLFSTKNGCNFINWWQRLLLRGRKADIAARPMTRHVFFIFVKQLRIASWGANIRMAIATVVVFWTPVEILGRMNLFSEIWIDPMNHVMEMGIILAVFIILTVYLWYMSAKKKKR